MRNDKTTSGTRKSSYDIGVRLRSFGQANSFFHLGTTGNDSNCVASGPLNTIHT